MVRVDSAFFSSPGVHAWVGSIRAATAESGQPSPLRGGLFTIAFFPSRERLGQRNEKNIQNSHFPQIRAPTGERFRIS
jgi:hypothetical protein